MRHVSALIQPDALREASAASGSVGGFVPPQEGLFLEQRWSSELHPELGLALGMFSCVFGVRSPGLAACTPDGMSCIGEVWEGKSTLSSYRSFLPALLHDAFTPQCDP